MNRIILLKSSYDEWEGLYIDNVLIEQGHTIGEGSSTEFWFNLGKKYPHSTFEVKYLVHDDEQILEEFGSMLVFLNEYKLGKY